MYVLLLSLLLLCITTTTTTTTTIFYDFCIIHSPFKKFSMGLMTILAKRGKLSSLIENAKVSIFKIIYALLLTSLF
jgi:hypothetical protein